jgi:hypothetical protein
MGNNYLSKILILLMALFTGPVLARTVTGEISVLTTWSDGHSVIKIENGPINGCPAQYYYSLGVKDQDVKAGPMLSIALAAYMGGKPVHITTSDALCQGGEEKIVNISLTQ